MASELAELVDATELTPWQRFGARKWGRVKAFTFDIGKGRIQFYFGYCAEHGFFVNYPHGGRELLCCPTCDKAFLKRDGASEGCTIPREERELIGDEIAWITTRLMIKHGCKASEAKRSIRRILDREV